MDGGVTGATLVHLPTGRTRRIRLLAILRFDNRKQITRAENPSLFDENLFQDAADLGTSFGDVGLRGVEGLNGCLRLDA